MASRRLIPSSVTYFLLGNSALRMSHMGQSLPKWAVRAMSGLPPLATELRTSPEVRFVPEAGILLLTFDAEIPQR